MFEKGRKRESKGLAVLYFIIGLIILLLILGVIYFALVKLDYSDQIADPNAQVRSYVAEETAAPALPAEDDVFDDITADAEAVEPQELEDEELSLDDEDEFSVEDDPVEDDAAEDFDEVIQTLPPTPEPTATPEPTPTPAPEKIPASRISKARTKNFKVPSKPSSNGVIGITECEVYPANGNSVMRLNGYGYINSKSFNGKNAKSYMIVTQRSNGKQIAYQLTMKKGISHRAHPKAKCKNAASCDYRMFINVKKFQDDIYSLALVIAYKPAKSNTVKYAYYPFSSDVSFTVLDGKVVTPVTTVK